MDTPQTKYDASPGSIQPLIDTFWSAAGWRESPDWPADQDLRAAVQRGVMFPEPVVLSHDGWVATAQAAVGHVSLMEAEAAFVASLTSRRLDLRSVLASFLIARGLPDHGFTASTRGRQCAVCGLYSESAAEDLNVLNFERFKWGGVRRDNINYVAFDLQQFRLAPRLEPTAEDIRLGRTVLETLNDLPPDITASQAAAQLGFVKGNKAEREVLLDILGICGVLDTDDHPGFAREFVPWSARDLPSQRFVERAYPACWWKAAAGVNAGAAKSVLPTLT
ncbi:hypothetical protein ACWGID_23200 [Kribbella sp. NPDC054772]